MKRLGASGTLAGRLVGIAKLYWSGTEGNYNVMVMELLGPSLEALFKHCGSKFSLKTALMLGEQLVVLVLTQ